MKLLSSRLFWAGAFILLFLTEVLIALFVRDSFVRPYLGDVLAVMTVYCGARIIFPKKFAFLSAAVLILAVIVELVQLTDFASLFGEGSVIAVLLGSTFDFKDLLCYTVGGIICGVTDFIKYRQGKEASENDKL